jgi:tetratricopeptide (TPR) repeat protein
MHPWSDPDSSSLNRSQPSDQLPPDITLVGRQDELKLLQTTVAPARFGEIRASISLIFGNPGVGKSALAIHFANMLKMAFPRAQLYADLLRYPPGVDSRDVEPIQVFRRFLAALGKTSDEIPDNLDDLAVRFQEATDGQKIVIVLDNVMSYQQIERLIPRSESCHVIVTARQRMPELATPVEVKQLSPELSLELLRHTAPSRNIDDPDEAEAVRQVLAVCDGVPLAISVLGARLESNEQYTLTWIRNNLLKENNASAAFGPDRKKIAASFALSYGQLDDQAKSLFRRLGAVPGGSFEPYLAAALVGVPPANARLLLEELKNLRLIQQERDPNYFSMHSLARWYAEELLADDELSPAQAFEMVLDFFLTKATDFSKSLQSEFGAVHLHGTTAGQSDAIDENEPLSWFTAENLNIVATAKRACLAGYGEKTWRLCAALVGYFEISGEWESWRETHTAALVALDAQEHHVGRANVLRGLGRLSRALRRWNDAIHYYRDAAALFLQHGEAVDVGTTLQALGDVYRYTRNWDSAFNCLTMAHEILERAGHARGVAIAKRSLGTIPRVRGQFADAIQLYDDAIVILEKAGDERWLAATRLSRADILLDLRQLSARKDLEECLKTFERFKDRHWCALTLRSLGEALRLEGDRAGALNRLRQSLELLQQSGDRLWEAQVEHSIGLVYLDGGDPVEALKRFNKALEQFALDGDTLWEGRTQVSIGRAKELLASDPIASGTLDAYHHAWPLLVEQGAGHDLGGLEELIGRHRPQ